MKKIQILSSVLILAIGFFTLSMGIMSFKSDDTVLTVIANEKGAPSSLTMKELVSISSGEKQRWADGTKVSLAFLKTSTPGGSATAFKLMKMSGDQFNKHWLALVFQGKSKAPNFFGSSQELDAFVSSTPGAIGIVEASSNPKSRIIEVNGQKTF